MSFQEIPRDAVRIPAHTHLTETFICFVFHTVIVANEIIFTVVFLYLFNMLILLLYFEMSKYEIVMLGHNQVMVYLF